jgi:hypothetical protein
VISINGGKLELIDPHSATVSHSIALATGVIEVGLFDAGRRALVINQRENRVSLIDLATVTLKGEIEVAEKPDQISFSREFAYIRGQATSKMSMLNLQQARDGRLQAIAVPMGQRAPDEAIQAVNVAKVIAPVPEGNGVLVANPADATIYRYAEGLMVPAGNFSNYRRAARAMMVLDSSLSERTPGQFEAPTRIEFGGTYDVIVKNLKPAITQCFTVSVAGPDVRQATGPNALSLAIRLQSVKVTIDGLAAIRISLSTPESIAVTDAENAMLLALQTKGTWQRRGPLRHLGEGIYEAVIALPSSGLLNLLLSVPNYDLGFANGRAGQIEYANGNWQALVSEKSNHAAR